MAQDEFRNRMQSMFGFMIPRPPEPPTVRSFTTEVKDDGAVVVAAGGSLGTFLDLEGVVRTEAELVTKYRELALQPEVDRAINEVVNDSIVVEEGKETVQLVLDDIDLNPNLKDVIEGEFKEILDILDFRNQCYDIFRRWYIEGRHYYHVVIDEARPNEGIKQLRWIDPRKIRKIREVVKVRDPKTNAIIQKTKDEYYLYSEMGLNYGSKVIANLGTTGLRIKLDSIIHVTSGVTDQNNLMVISFLHGAIKPMNMLRALEDSTLIYHLSRAPERRVFYVDVGNLPKHKAEQYLSDLMNRYKNKLSYNAVTGEVRDDRKIMSFLEDYWLPRREGGRGTEIDVMSSGTALPQLLQTVEQFQDKLYRSLQVPTSRMKPDALYSLGRATEISRDEVNFSKFIDRIRNKFSQLFIKAMEKQLILKGITTVDDWDVIAKYIRFRWLRDVQFEEQKEQALLLGRLEVLQMIDQFKFIYFSPTYIRKHVLKQSEEDIEQMDMESAEDMHNPMYNQALLMDEDQQSENAAQNANRR